MTRTLSRWAVLLGLCAIAPIVAASATVGINQMTVVHKNSEGVSIAFPDVCKTPSPSGPVPIPYPNISMPSDTETTTRKPAANEEGTRVRKPAEQIYRLQGRANSSVVIRQTEGDDGRIEATYIDRSGRKLRLREPALIEMENGEYCAICATRDGKVTAVYRLLPDTLRKKK